MEVRDAVEADAEALADIADSPVDVMRNLVHDRTVRVAEEDDEGAGADEDDRSGGESGTSNGEVDRDRETEPTGALDGFVSFDARDRTVHVTQLGGTREACERLLEEPIGFASAENMAVELLVERDDEKTRAAVERAGFSERGSGPAFGGTTTTRYRFEAD